MTEGSVSKRCTCTDGGRRLGARCPKLRLKTVRGYRDHITKYLIPPVIGLRATAGRPYLGWFAALCSMRPVGRVEQGRDTPLISPFVFLLLW